MLAGSDRCECQQAPEAARRTHRLPFSLLPGQPFRASISSSIKWGYYLDFIRWLGAVCTAAPSLVCIFINVPVPIS